MKRTRTLLRGIEYRKGERVRDTTFANEIVQLRRSEFTRPFGRVSLTFCFLSICVFVNAVYDIGMTRSTIPVDYFYD